MFCTRRHPLAAWLSSLLIEPVTKIVRSNFLGPAPNIEPCLGVTSFVVDKEVGPPFAAGLVLSRSGPLFLVPFLLLFLEA